MTEKDRVINEAIDRIMGIVRDGFSTVQDLERTVTELFESGYKLGYDDGVIDGYSDGYDDGERDMKQNVRTLVRDL